MRFPEQTRMGSEAHHSARGRLDEAREHHRHLSEVHDAAKQTPDERVAATDLAAATEQVAAREAWVSWIERGY